MDLVHKGDSGIAVGRIQQALVEAGYSVPQPELMAISFGEGTYLAVCAFQASHLGPSGHPLSEDGVVGDETWYALEHPGLSGSARYIASGWRCEPLQERAAVRYVLTAAVGEIGVFEDPDGSNDGPKIRQYTAPDFIGKPWCALFASWCFNKGCDNGSPFGRLAATWAIYRWGVANGRVLSAADDLAAGDVGLILRGADSDPNHRGHTVILVNIAPGGVISTCEGNASNAVRGVVCTRQRFSAIVRPVAL